MTYSTEGEEVVLSRMREIRTSGSVRGLVADSPQKGVGHEAYSTVRAKGSAAPAESDRGGSSLWNL